MAKLDSVIIINSSTEAVFCPCLCAVAAVSEVSVPGSISASGVHRDPLMGL